MRTKKNPDPYVKRLKETAPKRYLWTGDASEKKFCKFTNIRIRVNGASYG